jgi:hypothetical protein
MAVRKKLSHDAKTREKIQSSQLVNALMNHSLGKNEMSATQVAAARILLGKTLPDLQSIQHSGDKENPIETSIKVSFV